MDAGTFAEIASSVSHIAILFMLIVMFYTR